ncbi:protein D2 [Aethina tumida]|uniref:protein D2 n=1 Tax=Aethina tumida TaxID=116153 RepID=UPI00096B4F13|nr:protein D2 [Aethina tumida]
MDQAGLTPTVIDAVPADLLSVTYPNNVVVECGAELKPAQVENEPTVTWSADPGKYYLLLMIDPDAPSKTRPFIGQVNHWMVGNIPGNDVRSPNSDVIVEYRGSGPPKNTGLHRYVFLVYEQEGKMGFDERRSHAKTYANRFKFSAKKFSEKYRLGNPIAGNYFQAQWDEHVEEANKNVSIPIQVMFQYVWNKLFF